MTGLTQISGSCLCGGVRLLVADVDPRLGACHCGMCRKWSGGPLLALDCGSEVVFEGEADISVFASSAWAERGFCSRCGSHLFYKIKANGQHFIPVGLLDDCDRITFEHQIFIDRKPDYYDFSNVTKTLTEAEVFALHGA
ncbi:MAG: GFA family protein [Xanthomonadaceae bacterium]|jgi:hypothetical protein|nr:GFA family protein [Xanthomonadaceae bacterium]